MWLPFSQHVYLNFHLCRQVTSFCFYSLFLSLTALTTYTSGNTWKCWIHLSADPLHFPYVTFLQTYWTSLPFPFKWIVSTLGLWCWCCVLSGQVGNTSARYARWSTEINYDVSSQRQLHDRRVPGDIASWEVKGKGLPEVCITVQPVLTGKHSSGSLSLLFPSILWAFSSGFCIYQHFFFYDTNTFGFVCRRFLFWLQHTQPR